MADGIYSMYGDYAPIKELKALSIKYPQLHLYIDDVHGMSWIGKNAFISKRMFFKVLNICEPIDFLSIIILTKKVTNTLL